MKFTVNNTSDIFILYLNSLTFDKRNLDFFQKAKIVYHYINVFLNKKRGSEGWIPLTSLNLPHFSVSL